MRQSFISAFECKYIPEPNSGCWLWTASCSRLGYGNFGYGGTSKKAHRVSWELYRGPIPDAQCVLHKCDNRACVNPDHLFLGTQLDNIADMVAKGRARSAGHIGDDHPMSKLTSANVLEIRSRLDAGAPQRSLCLIYGVSPMTINRIALRKAWAHV